MLTRIRNAWAVLIGKAIVCTHPTTITTSLNLTVGRRTYLGNPKFETSIPWVVTYR